MIQIFIQLDIQLEIQGKLSKELDLNYYYSNVDHPMSTKLRNSGSTNYMTAKYKTHQHMEKKSKMLWKLLIVQ